MSYKEAAAAMKAGLAREDAERAAKREAERAEWQAKLVKYQADRAAAEAAATRIAKCSCGAEAPSTPYLAFYRTAEQDAQDSCEICRYSESAHAPEVRQRPHMRRAMSDGHAFVQRVPADHDSYYCGCRGWD